MSVVEIMEKLPRLSLAERRTLTRKLMELEPEKEMLEICDGLTDQALQLLDQREAEDAQSAQG